jgi:thiol-disulfide isomerase/thioredoxin
MQQKSIVSSILLIVVVIAVITVYYVSTHSATTSRMSNSTTQSGGDDAPAQMVDTMESGELMKKNEESAEMVPEAFMAAPFTPYTKAQYDEAVSSGKLVVLFYYANWCPTCKKELPLATAAFAKCQQVALRVLSLITKTAKHRPMR